MTDLIAKLRVVLTSLPAWLAFFTAALLLASVELVPLLPEPWGIRVAAWCVAALAFLRSAGEVVARLTTVLPEQRGVLNPEGRRVETVTVIDADVIDTPGAPGGVRTGWED